MGDHEFPFQLAGGEGVEGDGPLLAGEGGAEGVPGPVQRHFLAQEVLEGLVLQRDLADGNADEHDMAAGAGQLGGKVDRGGMAGGLDDEVAIQP